MSTSLSFTRAFLICLAIAGLMTQAGAQTPTLVGTLLVDVSVDNKGGANATIPLQIPPGRSGLQPTLSLSYNSQAGNGPLGIGWSLSTGFPQGITRGRSILARDGVVRGVAFTADDKFYLDGKRLIYINGGTGYGTPGSTYRTEVDSFVTITTVGTGSNIETFVVADKSGTKMTFGKINGTTDGYQTGNLGTGRETTDTLAYTWALKKVEDVLGNHCTLTYLYPGDGEWLLDRLEYNPVGAGPAFRAKIAFTYSSGRPDVNMRSIAERRFATTRRLDTITASFDPGAGLQTTARYDLSYESAPGAGLTRLKSVTANLINSESSTLEAAPPTVVTWSDETVSYSAPVPLSAGEWNMPFFWGDIDNDGRDDLIYLSSQGVMVRRASAAGLGAAYLAANLPAALSGLERVFIKGCDVNGDGRKDLVIGQAGHNGGGIYLALSDGENFRAPGGSATPALIYSLASPSTDFVDPGLTTRAFAEREGRAVGARITFADFNGDGRDDMLLHRYDGHMTISYANGSGFGTPVSQPDQRIHGLSGFHHLGWTYQYLGFVVCDDFAVSPMPCDINGDGLVDYAWVETNNLMGGNPMAGGGSGYTPPYMGGMVQVLCYRLQRDNGTFGGTRVLDSHGYAGDSGYPLGFRGNLVRYQPCDVNGDGQTDFAVIRAHEPANNPNPPQYSYEYAQVVFSVDIGVWVSRGGNDGRFEYIQLPSAVNIGNKKFAPVYDKLDYGQYLNFGYGSPSNMPTPGHLQCWNAVALSSSGDNMAFDDVNNDGLSDYIWYQRDSGAPEPEDAATVATTGLPFNYEGWLVMYSRGTSFSPPVPVPLGYTPTARPQDDPFDDYRPQTNSKIDINGDGLLEIVNMDSPFGSLPQLTNYRLNTGTRGNLVTAITDGLGRTSQVAYKAAKDDAVYSPGVPVTYPIRELRASTPVVSDLYKDSGGSTPAHFSYQYSGNRTDLSGRGSLGFHSFVTLDHQTNLFKYQFLTQSFPMTGLTAREQTYRFWESGSGQSSAVNFRLISSHDNTVVFDEVVNSGGTAYGTVYPFMSKAVESRWENSNTPHFTLSKAGSATAKPEALFPAARPGGAHITIGAQSWFDNQPLSTSPPTTLPGPYYASDRTTDWSQAGTNVVTGIANYAAFDALNFPRQITYGNLRKLETDFGGGFTEKVETTYEAPTSNGITGRVDTVTTTVTSPDYGTEVAPIKLFDYWSAPGGTPTPLVASETIDASDNTLDLTTTYGRDSLGRVTSTSISGYNNPGHPQHIGSYTVSTVQSFDARFDLPTVSRNAYGHETAVVYHPFFGLPTSITDANGAEVTTQYDALARVTQTRDVLKNLQTDYTYAWNTGIRYGVADYYPSSYSVMTATTGKPTTLAFYDRLGRMRFSESEGFAGNPIGSIGNPLSTGTEYNHLGQLTASYGYDSVQTLYTYDELGRTKTVLTPNNTTTTTNYIGRVTQIEVDGRYGGITGGGGGSVQTNTTLVDAKGRTVKVWNADNVPGSIDPVAGSTSDASIEYKLDGFGRMRATILKGQSQAITATYDALGRQISLSDPDKGSWAYVNNALGQVVSQTDANSNVTISSFDRLGRPLTRTTTEPSSGPVETANWFYYDLASNVGNYPHLVAKGTEGWIGSIQREESATAGAPGYVPGNTLSAYYYDTKGRVSTKLNNIDGKWFYTWTSYDAVNRLKDVRHYWRPPGQENPGDPATSWESYGYSNSYSPRGYLMSVVDTQNRVWWEADPSSGYEWYSDRLSSFTKGSSYYTYRSYDHPTGFLTYQIAWGVPSEHILYENWWEYDGYNNTSTRYGSSSGSVYTHEYYNYDVLNRLTHRNGQQIAAYHSNGNIDWKKDVDGNSSASYVYDANKPHAVTSAWGYAISYDNNGNLLSRSGGGQTWTTKWAGFDKPRWLAKAPIGSEFHYNANRSRVVHLEFDQMSGGAPSHYTSKKIYAAGAEMEVEYKNTASSGVSWQQDTVRIYIPAPDGIAGTREFRAFDPTVQEKLLVYHNDALGSVVAITPFGDTSGNAALDYNGKPTSYSYDAWGQRRDALSYSGPPVDTAPGGDADVTPRGYTGHEMLDGLGLVHMNGRIYDPLLGRFLSGDLVVQYPDSLQSYNRYSYVRNNPLSLVDLTGFTDGPPLIFARVQVTDYGANNSTNGVATMTITSSRLQRAFGFGEVSIFGATGSDRMQKLESIAGPTNWGNVIVAIAPVAGTLIGDALSTGETPAEKPVEENKPETGSDGGTINPQQPAPEGGSQLSETRYTQEGETFRRYESEDKDYSKINPDGSVKPGTFAAPASDPPVAQDQVAGAYNLPNPEIPRTNVTEITPPPGTPVIGPRSVDGGTGTEVIFPNGVPPGSAGTPQPVPQTTPVTPTVNDPLRKRI
jgi:RHS repeat-associated protein